MVVKVPVGMPRFMVRVVSATLGVLWVVYRVVVSLVVASVGACGAGNVAGWWWCCSWWGVVMEGSKAVLGLRVDPVW